MAIKACGVRHVPVSFTVLSIRIGLMLLALARMRPEERKGLGIHAKFRAWIRVKSTPYSVRIQVLLAVGSICSKHGTLKAWEAVRSTILRNEGH